jgi:hypothetical protein
MLYPQSCSRGISYIPSRRPHIYLHTYHSRFIPEGVAEVSQIFLRDTHVLPKLVSYKEHYYTDVTGGKTIAVLLQSISAVSAINPLVAFYDIHGGKREAPLSILLFCPGHHTRCPRCAKITWLRGILTNTTYY